MTKTPRSKSHGKKSYANIFLAKMEGCALCFSPAFIIRMMSMAKKNILASFHFQVRLKMVVWIRVMFSVPLYFPSLYCIVFNLDFHCFVYFLVCIIAIAQQMIVLMGAMFCAPLYPPCVAPHPMGLNLSLLNLTAGLAN